MNSDIISGMIFNLHDNCINFSNLICSRNWQLKIFSINVEGNIVESCMNSWIRKTRLLTHDPSYDGCFLWSWFNICDWTRKNRVHNINNWPLQAPYTTYVLCVNFIYEWRDLQFNVDPELSIFAKLFMAILFALRVLSRNLLRGSRQRNIFSYFPLMSDLGFERQPFT